MLDGKTIAIMQPYFLPYIGYFQLVAATDRFVFLDDANFIKQGWINRNQYLTPNGRQVFTVPLKGASSNKKINDVPLAIDDRWKRKFFASIENSYSRALQYEMTIDFLHQLFDRNYTSIADLAIASVEGVCQYAGLTTEFCRSSVNYQNANLKGKDRILDICAREETEHYVNAPGGRDLYDADCFKRANVNLKFIEPQIESYDQFRDGFESSLSVLDAMMWVEKSEFAKHCARFKLVD